MLLRVNVTQRHIDRGLQLVPEACPVALALRPFFPDVSCVSVNSRDIVVWNKRQMTWYPTPTPVKAFIARFDHNHQVLPFSFELNIH